MAGISSKAAGKLENKLKFNDGTELNTDLDINLYETDFRTLDPQIGRFHQIDPLGELFEDESLYSFAGNNPISYNDPYGLSKTDSASNCKPKPPPPPPPPPPAPPVPAPPASEKSSSVGQPGLIESFIPVWGSGRAAIDDFQNGNWGWGIFNTVMAAADVVTIGGASTLVKGGIEAIAKLGAKEAGFVVSTKATQGILLNEAINITEQRFIKLMQCHYPRTGMFLDKSKFYGSARELVELIRQNAQIPKTLQRNGNYQRIVNAGREIGIDATTGNPTSIFTIITNKAGDLITSFPGLPN